MSTSETRETPNERENVAEKNSNVFNMVFASFFNHRMISSTAGHFRFRAFASQNVMVLTSHLPFLLFVTYPDNNAFSYSTITHDLLTAFS